MRPDNLEIAMGFALMYGFAIVTIALVWMLKQTKPVAKTKLDVGPLYTVWVRCDSQQPVSLWSAVSCGDDPNQLCDAVRTEYKAKKWDMLVLPTNEKPQ